MRRSVNLVGDTQKAFAKSLIDQAAIDDVMRISKRTRSTDQNDLMWALIGEIMKHPSNERPHWTEKQWKCGLMQYCGHQIQWDQGLGDCGPLPFEFSSSVLNVKQMTALIETIYAYGAENGVVFNSGREL